jgi:RimJ/RimL family protein N-acetyltransferase
VEARVSRPPFVVRSSEVPEVEDSYPAPFDTEKLAWSRELGRAGGCRSLGAHRQRLPAGRRTSFTHAHSREEELVYVLSGRPSVRWVEPGKEPQEYVLQPGDLLVFPAGTALAHTVINHSEEDAELLVVGERRPSDRVFYPEDPTYDAWFATRRPLYTWESPASRDEHATWPAVRIETERLVLRPWAEQDLLDLYDAQMRNQPHLARFMPWATTLPTLAEMHERVLQWQVKKPGQREVFYGVFTPEGRVVGGTGYHERVGEYGLEIGYWIDLQFQGKGYVTEWVAAMTRLGIEVLELDRLEIHCDPLNTRSAAVPDRLGFTFEGVLPRRNRGSDGQPTDTKIFCLYASGYPTSPAADAQVRAWDALGRRLM